MPTPPLPQNLIDQFTSRAQAVRRIIVLKEVREFRAFCCDINSNGIMGVAKEPVPVISVTPNPICAGASISWDVSDSYAPGSTVTSITVDFGDGSPTTSSTSGTHTYAAAGTYEFQVTVGEGGGRNQTSTVEIVVVDCGTPITGAWSYASTDGYGVFFIDWSDDTPEWQARNTGLEGIALNVRALKLKPGTKHLSPVNHELWAATADGVYRTTNGGNNWEKLVLPNPSNLEFMEVVPITVEQLDFVNVVFDPLDDNTVYVEARVVE